MSGATAAMAVQGAGAGFSMIGSMNAAGAQQDALNYQAQVAANNAIIAGYQASIAKDVGETQEQNSRLRTADLYSTQRASMAANGIDLGEGTATDVLASTKYMGERDALTIRDNTANKVWALQNNAQNFLNDAAATRATADSINPFMSGAGSLLTSAGSVAKSYYAMKTVGATK